MNNKNSLLSAAGILALAVLFFCGVFFFEGKVDDIAKASGESEGDAANPVSRSSHQSPSSDPAMQPFGGGDTGAASEPSSVADLLEGVDLSDPKQRAKAVEGAQQIGKRNRDAGARAARLAGLPERVVHPDGRVQEVCGVDPAGRPIYFTTHNANASITSGSNLLRNPPYSLQGVPSLKVGVWDGGAVRDTHQEFGDRVLVRDGAGIIDHATHVAGTIAAEGWSTNARGVGADIPVSSYDWNNDRSEMIGAAAATAHEAIGSGDKILVSNHSYGYVVGWNYVGGGTPFRAWEWWGNGSVAGDVESDFGMYNTFSRDTDALAAGAPYFLMVRSAGNDRNNNPAAGSSVALFPGSDTVVTYDAALHPAGDGSYRGGYDTISYDAVAKNVLTVGSVADSVTAGSRDINKANVSSFSVYGPTDDGRIKPDLVANGESLFSTTGAGDANYGNLSGTSMAAPGVTGLAMLLAEQHVMERGSAMRASSLKGLLIHTADDRGNVGPDYRFGWGLVNGKAAADLLIDDYDYPAKNRMVEGSLASSGGAASFTFTWDGASPIRATLCWTDPAGTATAIGDSRTSRLAHNLDIKLVSPGGTSYFPYVMPFVGTWTQASSALAATTGLNDTDNVEQVFIAAPGEQGVWTVQVSRRGNLTSSQPYSLFVSGSTAVQNATVSITNTSHTYDGGAKQVQVSTVPADLPVSVTYNGSSSLPINAGSYSVVASVIDPLFTGSSTATMQIAKAQQTISFPVIGNKIFGDPDFATLATSSSGLALSFSSSDAGIASLEAGGVVKIVGAGVAAITANQSGDSNWEPAVRVTREFTVSKALGAVSLGDLEAVYDGIGKSASVQTSPPGLGVSILYDGFSDEPVNPGSYSVSAVIDDLNYEGSTSGVLRIQDFVGDSSYEDWKITNFGDPSIPSGGDEDGDGTPNVVEFYLQLDPLDPLSRLKAAVGVKAGGGLQLELSPAVGRGSYTLREWTNLLTNPSSTPIVPTEAEIGAGKIIREVGGSGNKFYQIIYNPPFNNP
jgi:subtilisin family serine protease